MTDMVEVVIDSVRVSLMSPQRVVVLRQVDEERFLPIWVGPYEAEAITVALQEIEMIRPLTHDLLKSLFNTFNARVSRVEIIALREEIFFGNIVAEVDGSEINIDSRPSDAIALAVRANVSIFVHHTVMEEAGMVPEKDMGGEEKPPLDETAGATGGDDGGDRLSIFEDFIDKLDMGKLDDKDKPEDDDPDDKKN